jgi:hypothetical protein
MEENEQVGFQEEGHDEENEEDNEENEGSEGF